MIIKKKWLLLQTGSFTVDNFVLSSICSNYLFYFRNVRSQLFSRIVVLKNSLKVTVKHRSFFSKFTTSVVLTSLQKGLSRTCFPFKTISKDSFFYRTLYGDCVSLNFLGSIQNI